MTITFKNYIFLRPKRRFLQKPIYRIMKHRLIKDTKICKIMVFGFVGTVPDFACWARCHASNKMARPTSSASSGQQEPLLLIAIGIIARRPLAFGLFETLKCDRSPQAFPCRRNSGGRLMIESVDNSRISKRFYAGLWMISARRLQAFPARKWKIT